MTSLRPKDLAMFLLASGDMLPRNRARDQQADMAGLELKRRVLDMLISADPEPEALEQELLAIVTAIGPPSGPTRAICATVRDEWEAALSTPTLVDWLVGEALREGEDRPRRGRRGDRGPGGGGSGPRDDSSSGAQ
jgi:hypothetical protein